MLSGIKLLAMIFLISFGALTALGQTGNGRLTGKVVDVEGKPLAGVAVIVTNQVSSDAKRTRTRQDGSYSVKLNKGAYRITVAPPHEARFDRGKTTEYGGFSNLICDETRKKCSALENVSATVIR